MLSHLLGLFFLQLWVLVWLQSGCGKSPDELKSQKVPRRFVGGGARELGRAACGSGGCLVQFVLAAAKCACAGQMGQPDNDLGIGSREVRSRWGNWDLRGQQAGVCHVLKESSGDWKGTGHHV